MIRKEHVSKAAEEDDEFDFDTPLINEYTPMVASPHAPHDKRPSKCSQVIADYRLVEFTAAFIAGGIAMAFSFTAVHDRAIPNIEVRIAPDQTYWALDPSINQKKLAETVPMPMLVIVGTGIPIFTNLFMNYILPKFKCIRVIPHDTRDFHLSLITSISLSQLLTHFIKNMTGRFRPSFYDMCGWNREVVWDGITNLCTSAKWEKEGRKSFPSGHASYAWATLFYLTLYLLGRSKLAAENRSDCAYRGGRKTIKLFICFAPTLVAAWVAITRSIDNWHHYSDILAGSIIGAFSAGFGYCYNYGSIFSWESAGMPYQHFHNERRKKNSEDSEESTGRSTLGTPHGTSSGAAGLATPPSIQHTNSNEGDFVITVSPR